MSKRPVGACGDGRSTVDLRHNFWGGRAVTAWWYSFQFFKEVPEVRIEIGNIYSLPVRMMIPAVDAGDQSFKPVPFVGAFDLLRHRNFIGEGDKHQVPAGKGNFGGHPRAFGRNGFLGDLNQDVHVGFEHLVNFPGLLNICLKFKIADGKGIAVIRLAVPDIFQQGLNLGAQIEVVEKSVLVVTNIHESGIQPRHDLFDPAQVNIANSKFVVGFLLV